MPRIYISHFRHDTSHNDVDTIRTRFSSHIGADNVLDTTKITSATTTDRQQAVWSCNGLIVVFGRYALNMFSENDTRLIEDPYEPVHVEIDAGLRSGMQVVVLMVDGTPKLTLAQLPEPLQPLMNQATHYQVYNETELDSLLDTLVAVRWNSTARIPKLKKPVSLTAGYDNLLADPNENRYQSSPPPPPQPLPRYRNPSSSANKQISLTAGFDNLLADDTSRHRYGLHNPKDTQPRVHTPSRRTTNRQRQQTPSPNRNTSHHPKKSVSLVNGYENLLADDPNKTHDRPQNRKLRGFMDRAVDWLLNP